MINKIIHFSVYNRNIVLFLTLLFAGIGWYGFTHMSIDAVPDITNNQVQIFTQVPGLSAEEIERTVTYPVETSMSGIAGVEQLRSLSRFGLSVVVVVFEDGMDIYRARQMVSERLISVQSDLPKGAQPKLGPITTGLGEIFFYTIEAAKIETGEKRLEQLMELRSIQEFLVKPRLLTVPGVAEVNTIGGFEKQFHIQPNPRKLTEFGISFEDITEALENTNRNTGGGYIQQTSEQFIVQGNGLFTSVEDIESTPVKNIDSLRSILIKDIAQVTLASELRTGAALVGEEEAVLGTAMMLLGENSRIVSTRVAERLKEIQESLPAGYKITPVYDRSELVNATLSTIEHNLLIGATLVIVILLLLLGNIRAAVITAFVIPLSLLLTFIAMKRFGISGNLLSLGALDFGIIVDGAVIVLDHCVRKIRDRAKDLNRSLSRDEVQATVYNATVEIRTAAGFGELIVVVVFLPVLALQGIEGKMFQPMAATFAIAVFSALILSFSTVPALASLFLKGDLKEKEPWLMQLAERLYSPFLALAVRFRKATVAVGVISLILGIFLFSRLGGEFLPQMDEASRTFQFVRPVNIGIDQSVVLQKKSQKIISEFPEVKTVFSRIGTAEVATDPMGVNLADTFIMFKDRSEWPKGEGASKTWAEVTSKIQARLEEEIAGQRVLISQPIQMRFNELLEGTRADVSVKVFGEEMETMTEISEQIAKALREVKGSGDVEVEVQGTSPMLRIIPKASLLSNIGIPGKEVLETVGIALGGEEVGHIFEGVRRFPIIVRLNEADRMNLELVRNLPVEVGERATAPLKQVADIRFDETFGAINREQSKRRTAVMINPRGVDTETFVLNAQKKVAEKVKIPPGYYLEWGGNFKNLQVARLRLLIFAPIVLLLVLAMVFWAFRSLPQTALVFVGVPLALVGGVLGLKLNGLPFSISAGIGFIALSGISVLNGIVLVNCFNDLHLKGLRGVGLVKHGTLLRLRPVLMTALVAMFGFLPMMVSTGVGAEVQRPLASVVIGGLFSATALTLLVLPTLYLIFERYMKVDPARTPSVH
tara:strand:- start:49902 stop:53051 length:3150 start_codon:yes stop_codon:yes gene_type:complete